MELLKSREREDDLLIEFDPTNRYGRYDKLIGSGAVKRVFLGFDTQTRKEIAWNQVQFIKGSEDIEEMMDRVRLEVQLLRSFNNEHIITLYNEWTNVQEVDNTITINFITEYCTSGDLRQYRQKHRHVSLDAIKRWCKQILKGLKYLHTHEPCIIHKDLNCNNVFVHGNNDQVKIGDFGAAEIMGKNPVVHSVLGTPAYMAPELLEEDYTETIDIYSFGMCMLELVTLEKPYSECNNVYNIYEKILSGEWPKAVDKVKDPDVKAFIERCLGQPRNRPSASELLEDPFFDGIQD